MKLRARKIKPARWRALLKCGECGWTGFETSPGEDYACPDCGEVESFTGIRIGGRPGALDRCPKFRG